MMRRTILAVAAVAAGFGVVAPATAMAQGQSSDPCIHIIKTNDDPLNTLPAPGGTFHYTVTISYLDTAGPPFFCSGGFPDAITRVEDLVFPGGPVGGPPVRHVIATTGFAVNGQCANLLGQYNPGDVRSCMFTETVTNGVPTPTNVPGASAMEDQVEVQGNGCLDNFPISTCLVGPFFVNDSNRVPVFLGAVLPPGTPKLAAFKTASPLTRDVPGGPFVFSVGVTNTGNVPLTITALTDNIYGNLATIPGSTCGALIGTTLAPGASSATCTFTGSFTGTAPASQTDTITVTGATTGDPPVTTTTATASATVSLTAPDTNEPGETTENNTNSAIFTNLVTATNTLTNTNTSTNTNTNNTNSSATSNSNSSVTNNPSITITNNPTINITSPAPAPQIGAPGAPGPTVYLQQHQAINLGHYRHHHRWRHHR